MALSRPLVLLLLAIAILALLPPASRAQTAEASIFFGAVRISDKDLGSIGIGELPLTLDDGFKTGGRLTLGAGKLLAHELSYGFERHDVKVNNQTDNTSSVHQFFYDLVLHVLPSGSTVRPFVLGGLGFATFVPGSSDLFQLASGETKFGWNYGGGVKVKLAPIFGIRVDIRDHVTAKPNFLDLPNVDGKMHSLEISGGVSFFF